jgi:hypothetical protein
MIVALLVLVIFSTGAAVLGARESSGSGPGSEVRRVSLSTEFVTGQTGVPLVRVSVGSDPPVTVVLDTGSVGLRVLATRLHLGAAAGISVTSRPVSVTFADGTRDRGTIARAKFHIGGLTSTKAVPFELVKRSTCTLSDCHGLAQVNQEYGIAGTLGIGMSSPWRGTPNPLRLLANPYGSSWQVRIGTAVTQTTTGQLVLGAHLPSSGTTYQLQPQGDSSWSDEVPVCWTIGTRRFRLPTVFDTGSISFTLWSKRLPRLRSSHKGYFESSGTEVSISDCATTPILTFAADDDLNPVIVFPEGEPFGVAAVDVFYNLIVTYDVDSGLLNITPSPSAFEETGGN